MYQYNGSALEKKVKKSFGYIKVNEITKWKGRFNWSVYPPKFTHWSVHNNPASLNGLNGSMIAVQAVQVSGFGWTEPQFVVHRVQLGQTSRPIWNLNKSFDFVLFFIIFLSF